MGREKRKVPENGAGICVKKTKKVEQPPLPAEEPTDEEVEEFYLILRRIKEAAEYFGVGKKISTDSLRVVVGSAADREKEEEDAAADVMIEAPAPAGVKRRAKGKEVVEENGLRLDLNIAVAVETDGR